MFFSLSHTDLDGYSCQFLLNRAHKDITFFNSGYGKAISDNLSNIFEVITKEDTLYITDLNLTIEQSDLLNLKQAEKGFTLVLIDHHETGKPSAQKYEWYNLDISMSATKAVYLYLIEKNLIEKSNDLDFFVDCVNSLDMWEQTPKNLLSNTHIPKENFIIIGSSLSQNVVFGKRNYFPKIFEKENRELIFYILDNSVFLLQKESIMYFEEKIYNITRKFLGGNYKVSVFNQDKQNNSPLHILKADFLAKKVWDKNIFKEVKINFQDNEYKGMIFFGLDSIFQDFSHKLLEKNKTLDFVVNINEFGRLSFRSIRKFRMNYMVAALFNGGGHENACGGSLFEEYNKRTQEECFSQFEFLTNNEV